MAGFEGIMAGHDFSELKTFQRTGTTSAIKADSTKAIQESAAGIKTPEDAEKHARLVKNSGDKIAAWEKASPMEVYRSLKKGNAGTMASLSHAGQFAIDKGASAIGRHPIEAFGAVAGLGVAGAGYEYYENRKNSQTSYQG